MAGVVAVIAIVAGVPMPAETDVKARHPHEMYARAIAPHAAVVVHSWVPAHRHIVAPRGGEAHVHRAAVCKVLRDRVPASVLCGRVREEIALPQVEHRRGTFVDEIGLAAVGPAELHDVEVLV